MMSSSVQLKWSYRAKPCSPLSTLDSLGCCTVRVWARTAVTVFMLVPPPGPRFVEIVCLGVVVRRLSIVSLLYILVEPWSLWSRCSLFLVKIDRESGIASLVKTVLTSQMTAVHTDRPQRFPLISHALLCLSHNAIDANAMQIMQQVQEAVRTTVLGLLGSLPRHAFETTAIATGDALANLMFQLQMTGYMFKNAEYRLSLQSSMRASAFLPPGISTSDGSRTKSMCASVNGVEAPLSMGHSLSMGCRRFSYATCLEPHVRCAKCQGFDLSNPVPAVTTSLLYGRYLGKNIDDEAGEDGESFSTSRMEMDDEGNLIVTRPKISGKIKLTYNADKATEQAMEVDADAYMAELRGQVRVGLM